MKNFILLLVAVVSVSFGVSFNNAGAAPDFIGDTPCTIALGVKEYKGVMDIHYSWSNKGGVFVLSYNTINSETGGKEYAHRLVVNKSVLNSMIDATTKHTTGAIVYEEETMSLNNRWGLGLIDKAIIYAGKTNTGVRFMLGYAGKTGQKTGVTPAFYEKDYSALIKLINKAKAYQLEQIKAHKTKI